MHIFVCELTTIVYLREPFFLMHICFIVLSKLTIILVPNLECKALHSEIGNLRQTKTLQKTRSTRTTEDQVSKIKTPP